MAISLPHKYRARPYQVPFWQHMMAGGSALRKRAALEWHRRSGKDLTVWNFTILQTQLRVGIYYYFLPTYRQGKKIIWDGKDKHGNSFRSYIPRELVRAENETEMQIEFTNGSLLQIVGADNIDSIVGTNPVGCVFSEYSLIPEKAYNFVRPILAENDGWAVFVFTPRGRNHATDLFEKGRTLPRWYVQTLTVDHTLLEDGSRAVPEDEIQADRDEGMPEELIQQEYYCSRTGMTEGSFFKDSLDRAEAEGRIGLYPYDPMKLVHTAWDLGINDPMAIWFFQIHPGGPRFIDYRGYRPGDQPSLISLKDWIRELKSLPYIYGTHLAPHDIKVASLETGETRQEFAEKLNWFFTVVPKVGKKIEGIEAARRLLTRSAFNAGLCEKGLQALRAYRREWDDEKYIFKDVPVHDWSSNGADALQQAALGYNLVIDDDTTPRQTTADGDAPGEAEDFSAYSN